MTSKSNTIISVMIYVLAILSAAAGIPKILQMQQEVDFLSVIGLSGIAISILGVAQFVGGILLFLKRHQLPGAGLAALAFLVSSVAIFVGGNTIFGLVSLLPVLAAIIVISTIMRSKRATS